MALNLPDSDPSTQRPLGATLRTGDRVRVRRQRWIVTDLQSHGRCALVTLSGIEPFNRGAAKHVLVPFDVVEPIASRQTLRRVRASTWCRALRTLITASSATGVLKTATTARIDLLPYQLEPALAVIGGLGSRILIADEVGLGKTVQAALIVAELRARAAAARTLVLSPAGVRDQWREELQGRFGLTLVLIDARELRRRQAQLPVGVNPWSTEELVIASTDFIKRTEILPAVLACRWDIVIVDEAHHAAEASDRHAAVARLCENAARVVLLTATPHNGDAAAFASLSAIGSRGDDLIAFRRTRRSVGTPRRRHVHRLRVTLSAAERRMHTSLDAFLRLVEKERGRHAVAVQLGAATLRKRALSSPAALERSVERRLEGLSGSPSGAEWQLLLPLHEDDDRDAADDGPSWTLPALGDARLERSLLTRLLSEAREATNGETKLRALSRLLRRLHEPAIVFTEYRDTLLHVRERLSPSAPVIHGGLSRDERRKALECFAKGSLLLATDAAGEGLNLQHHCRVVINLELPWNPVRLEQRIGRVDRIGQTRNVHAFYLLARGTSEMRVLERLAERISLARRDAAAADPLSDEEDDSADPAPSMFVDLTEEAVEEHQRLQFGRALSVRANLDRAPRIGPVAGRLDQPLVSVAKRSNARALLGSRTLVVLESALRDANERIVGSHLTPMLVPEAADLRRVLEWIISRGLESIDPEFSQWLRRSSAVQETFWTICLRRDEKIASAFEESSGTEHQPGLFDRRAAHDVANAAHFRRERLDEIQQRIAHAERAASLTLLPPRLALILRR